MQEIWIFSIYTGIGGEINYAFVLINAFNIFNMIPRLKEMGDLFKPVLGKGINLDKIVEEMDKK